MTLSNFKQALREIEGISRVAELTDGLLLIDGSETILLLYGDSQWTSYRAKDRIAIIDEEFDKADHLLISIEGAVLLLEGTLSEFKISYLPDYLNGVGLEGLREAVRDLIRGTLGQTAIQKNHFFEYENSDITKLFDELLAANLTAYHTPSKVAYIAANWATAGDRGTILDAACGSGQLLTAAIDATEDPAYAMGVDQSGLVCAIAETRVRERNITNWKIRNDNFFSFVDEMSVDQQLSIDQYKSAIENGCPLPQGGFDCVVVHPPAGRWSDYENKPETTGSRSYSRIEDEFVNTACQLLADSGRGCFVLPSNAVRNLQQRVLPEGVALQKLIKLPEKVFPIVGVEPILACVERTTDGSEISVLNISSFENLDRVCGAVHSTKAAQSLDNVTSANVGGETSTTALRMLLSAPGAAPFLAGGFPTLEDVTKRIATGMTTGRNQVFYFDQEERTQTAISDQFFTPVIKSIPEEDPITDEQIDCYLFDLRDFVEENSLNKRDVDEVQAALESKDAEAAAYVEEVIAPTVRSRGGGNGVLPRSIPLTNPDLVTGAITTDVIWYRTDIKADEVLYDTQIVGISCDGKQDPDSLQTVLNTPFYQRLIKTSLPRLDADYVRVQINPLRSLPVFLNQLEEETLDRLNTLSPYDSQESRETAWTIILQDVDSTYRTAISQTYDAVSPLSTLAGYEAQIQQLRAALDRDDKDEDFEGDLVNTEIIDRLEDTFRSAELFTSRERLVAELLAVYSEERYWSFMGGTASQFEGMLQDYVENTGGQVEPRETEDGDTRLEYRYRGADWKPLRLKILLEDFFSGDLLDVMQSVRERRNVIAHGRLLDDPELNADIILLSFFVFTYALLAEYNEYLGAEEAGRGR